MRWRDRVPDLKLPHHGKFFAQSILIKGLQFNDVGKLSNGLIGRTAWKALNTHIRNRPGRASNFNYLTCLGEGWGTRRAVVRSLLSKRIC